MPVSRTASEWLGVYLRGAAMGVAELIPGVSGGTIAFITGIYRELLRSLAELHPRLVPALWREGPAAVWQRYNIAFLLVLGLGMLSSVLALARVMHWLLAHAPIHVWAFFFGLILGGCFEVGREIRYGQLLSAGVAGLALGAGLSVLGDGDAAVRQPMLFLGGAIAVSAWLLPGVSGSYMLLLLGLYPSVVAAVAALELAPLAVLGLGMATGLVLFAQLLAYLMRRFYQPVMALLTGFMAGSLATLWPWRLELADGPAGRVWHIPVSPARFAAVTEQEPALAGAVLMALTGLVVVLLLGRAGRLGA